MRVTVDTALCADHGQCIFSAPKVFHFDDEGKLVWQPAPDESLRVSVEEAADVCPVQAIRVDG